MYCWKGFIEGVCFAFLARKLVALNGGSEKEGLT